MCRLTAIISSKDSVCVGDIVTKPRLSIIYQSFNCHERLPRDRPRWAYEQSTLNGDGFGVGWYIPRAQRHIVEHPKRPCVFTSLKPAWGDKNLALLADNTVSPLIFAHVRAAGPGSGVPTETNCHPFRCGRFLFMHNGVLGNWSVLRKALLLKLETKMAFDWAMDNTPIDSVVIFALFIDLLDRGVAADYSANELRYKMTQVLAKLKVTLDELKIEEVSYMNCVVSDGCHMVASRYAVAPYTDRMSSNNSCEAENKQCQSLSLYFATGTKWVNEGSGDFRMTHSDKRHEVCIVTSEPLTEIREEWVPVPHNHLLIVTSNCDVLLHSLMHLSHCRPGKSEQRDGFPMNGCNILQPNSTCVPVVRKGISCPIPSGTIFRSLESLEATSCLSRDSQTYVYDAAPVWSTPATPGAHKYGDASLIQCRRLLEVKSVPLLCITTIQEASAKLLVIGDQNGYIRIWDFDSDQAIALLRAHKGSVLALQPYTEYVEEKDKCQTWLFSASADTTVAVWNISELLAAKKVESCSTLPAVRLYFEPLQGDVLSLAVIDDFIYFGYQSTTIGLIRLKTLFKRIRNCKALQNHHPFVTNGASLNGASLNGASLNGASLNGASLITEEDSDGIEDLHDDSDCSSHHCSISEHTTQDFLGAPQLVLSACTEVIPQDSSPRDVYNLAIMSMACSQSLSRNFDTTDTAPPPPPGDLIRYVSGVPPRACPQDPSESAASSSSDSSAMSFSDLRCRLDWFLLPSTGGDRHCGFVEALAVSNGRLISAGGDGLLLVWKRNRVISTLSGHTGGILCLAADYESTIYSGGRDTTIRVWDLDTFACKQVLKQHNSDVMAICLTPSFLISASIANEIFGWSRKYNEVVFHLSLGCFTRTPLNSAGNFTVTSLTSMGDASDVVCATTSDGFVRFWRLDELKETQNETIKSPEQLSDNPQNGQKYWSNDFKLLPTESVAHNFTQLCADKYPSGRNDTVEAGNESGEAEALCVGEAEALCVGEAEALCVGEKMEEISGAANSQEVVGSEFKRVEDAFWEVCKETVEGEKRKGRLSWLDRTEQSDDSLGKLERFLRPLMSIRSISGYPTFLSECWRAASYICGALEDLGAISKMFPTGPNTAPIVMGRFETNPSYLTVLLYSHYDVVPSGESHYHITPTPSHMSPPRRNSESHTWLADPWQLTKVNGYFYGRGTSDNKGPLAAQMTAIAELQQGRYSNEEYAKAFGIAEKVPLGSKGNERGEKEATAAARNLHHGNINLPVNIIMIIEGDEENGSNGFADFLERNGDFLSTVDAAIFTNTYWLDDKTPGLVYGMRGVIDVQVTVRGGEDPIGVHSGIHGGAVAEPLSDLVAVISNLVTPSGHVRIPSFYDDVLQRDLHGQDRSTLCHVSKKFDLDEYRIETGNAGLTDSDPKRLLSRRWDLPSLSMTEIWSSTQRSMYELGMNYRIIPSLVQMNISIRFVPIQKSEILIASLRNYLEAEFRRRQSPNKLEVKVMKCHDWWEGDRTSLLFKSASKAIEHVWGTEPLYTREGGTIAVLQQVQRCLKVPTVQIPIGQASDNAHLPNERLNCLNLVKGVEVLKMTLWRIGIEEQIH